MNRLNKYLIELCNAHFSGEPISLDSKINYNTLYDLSHAHNLGAIIFCVLNTADNKDIVDASVLKRYEDDFLESVVRYDYQKAQLDLLTSLFEKEGVRHIFFKGAVLKELYPTPEARIMSDIDVLIDADDRTRVHKILQNNGFAAKATGGAVNSFEKDKLLLEVHTKLVSGKVGNSSAEEVFKNAFDYAEFDGAKGAFNPSYHFAYLIAHIAHHFWFFGAGVRHILDLAAVLKGCDVDIDFALDLLDKAGLRDFAKNIISVCYKWFGVGVSYTDDTEKIEEFIFSFGVFGTEGRSGAAVVMRKDMESGKKVGAVSTRIRLLFPSYEQVKNIPYIPFIDGRPYLLVAAWAYRLYYNLRYKRAFLTRSTKDIGKKEIEKEAKAEFELFEEIGLL